MRRVLIMLAALGLAACAVGNGEGASAAPSEPVTDPVIAIENMEFVDGSVTVEAGTTVTWDWRDGPIEHSVVFDEVESPLQSEGTWSHTFTETGSYGYFCGPHPFMKGTITVVEADTA